MAQDEYEARRIHSFGRQDTPSIDFIKKSIPIEKELRQSTTIDERLRQQDSREILEHDEEDSGDELDRKLLGSPHFGEMDTVFG